MIPTITTYPTLQQLCATQIFSLGLDLTFKDNEQSLFEGVLLSKLWNTLKSGFPQGVLCLRNEMCKIDWPYENGNGQFLANVKISVLFRKLAEQFSGKFVEAGIPLNGLIPVDCQKYAQLQEILTKKWEDEALEVLWKRGGCRQVGFLAPKLDTLDEVRNWFKNPANAHALVHITFLNLFKCGIKTVPPEIGRCTQLESISFSENQITYLPESIFQGCTQLKSISLSENQITYLPEGIFQGCTQLQQIYLGNNQISTLPKALFAKCTRLNLLDLMGNQIVNLPEILFVNCALLDYHIAIEKNPLLCIFGSVLGNIIIPNERFFKRSALFSNYTCLSKLSHFVKLLSFGMENKGKIRDVFEQLEFQDRCLIVEMLGSVLGNINADPLKLEKHLLDDMHFFCKAIREAICEKFERIEDKEKVYRRLFYLGKLEIMEDKFFKSYHKRSFDLLLDPELEPELESVLASSLGEAYMHENVLLLIDAMGASWSLEH